MRTLIWEKPGNQSYLMVCLLLHPGGSTTSYRINRLIRTKLDILKVGNKYFLIPLYLQSQERFKSCTDESQKRFESGTVESQNKFKQT